MSIGTKIKDFFNNHIQQPLLFKLHLVLWSAALLLVPWVTALDMTAIHWSAAISLSLVLGSSLAYMLESVAFKPDRYVTANRYNSIKSVLTIAELHRKAMIQEVTSMKASKTKTRLSAILGVQPK